MVVPELEGCPNCGNTDVYCYSNNLTIIENDIKNTVTRVTRRSIWKMQYTAESPCGKDYMNGLVSFGMVSRDTVVHAGAIALALSISVLIQAFEVGTDSGGVSVLAFLLVYGLVFGGAHFYLALRGEDGMVPVGARWRYVGTLAVLLGAGAVSLAVGTRTVAGVELNTVALIVAGLALLIYFLTENLSAYREIRAE
jgi:hypothetical protein